MVPRPRSSGHFTTSRRWRTGRPRWLCRLATSPRRSMMDRPCRAPQRAQSLDLARLTAERQAESDARAGPDVFGADSPEWRLFAHAPLGALLPGDGFDLPLYLVVWVADDEWDGDGDPAVDSNERILVRAHAFGAGGTRAIGEARVARTGGGDLQILARR